MRIATSTIYEQQTSAIDSLVAQEALYGQQLSTGKAVNQPSDDPTQIAQDLSVRSEIAVQNQVGSNLTNTSAQLTSADSALTGLTGVLQSARSLAIQAASDTNTPSQLQEIAIQVGQLLQQSIGIANTQYAGTYLFAGTAAPSGALVTANGNPSSVVNVGGNNVAHTEQLPNGQVLTTSVTLQQAFNYGASDGSPNVFQVLQNLYDTLEKSQVLDQSSAQINTAGAAITLGTTLSQLVAPNTTAATPLTLDNGVPPAVSITIASALATNGVTFSFAPTQTIAQVEAAINLQSVATGVSASFNAQTDRLSLTAIQPFTVADAPTPGTGATTTGNFVETFNLQPQADVVQNLSRQLGDIDHVTQQLLNTQAQVGSTIQQVAALTQTSAATVTNDTGVQSSIEDTNIAKVQPEFSLTQTALQAAYGTTSQLEQKDLFDYIT